MKSIRLTVQDPKQIEIMQSAEILTRELRARGIAVSNTDAAIELTLSDKSLRDGSVEISHAGHIQLVKLEDAVDKVIEVSRV